jgi:hypothetical protein
MNVEIGAEATQFPEKEYINGIVVAVQLLRVYYLNFYRKCPALPLILSINKKNTVFE